MSEFLHHPEGTEESISQGPEVEVEQPKTEVAEASRYIDNEKLSEVAEKTGLSEKIVIGAYELFSSHESPIDIEQDEIEDFLIRLSSLPDATSKLAKLFDKTNLYTKDLFIAINHATGVEEYQLSDMEKVDGDIRLINRGFYITNNIIHLSNNFYQFMGRCHREYVDYEGLTDDINDELISDALRVAELNGTWYQVHDTKESIKNVSTGKVEEASTRNGSLSIHLGEMLEARNEIINALSSWDQEAVR